MSHYPESPCQYALFRLQRCKLRKKLRGVWICIFSMKKNKLQSIHSRQNERWTWHRGHLWYGRQKSGRMSVTGVWIDCDRWRHFLLNCTSTQTQHRGLATLSQFSDYGLMYQVKVGAQIVRRVSNSKARMYRNPLNQFPFPCLFVGAVEKLCICVTFAKKLGDWWCKLQLPDLSLLNSQISDTSPLSDFKLTFRFLPQRPVFNDGCVSVSREGRRKWSFIGIWRPGLPNACPTKLGLILGQKLQVARSTVAE